MFTAEQNRTLTRIGPETPMGELLRRYWQPVAGTAQLDSEPILPIRILGEDLVLYRDKSGHIGLLARHCPHRRADLAHGILDARGLRCSYHGWCFDAAGCAVERPFEDTGRSGISRLKMATAYPVTEKAGIVWAYLGPEPAPLLPDWEPFSWENGFVQVVVSEVPCNWFQCQENSIDPVHFEWMHETWGGDLNGRATPAPRHLELAFEEFEHGFVYRRIRENTDVTSQQWTVGRVCLWPNGFFLGEHFEWRVPIDDENTLSVLWKYLRVPRESEPFVQHRIPCWRGPVSDSEGRVITSHVMNQDFVAWIGQGRIADRTRERLGRSDRGIVMLRERFFAELQRVAEGHDPKGVMRDPAANQCLELPVMERDLITASRSRAEILADPRKRFLHTTFFLQAGQPDEVRQEFELASGLEALDFEGLRRR